MEIVKMDALEYLNGFQDSIFDMVVLDPDYQDWDNLVKKGVIAEAVRVLKDSGNLICFTKQPFDYNLRISINNYFRREIIWTFENGGAWCSPKMPLISSQKIYWCVKSPKFYFNPRTGVPYNNSTKDFKRKTKVFGNYTSEGRDFIKSEEGVWIRDHLHYNKPNSGKIPAKPQQLVEILLKCFCPDGGTVCDPFTGTGVFPLTAERQGKEAFASDINEDRVMSVLDAYFAEDRIGE
jgi:DNA modification methylase